MKLERIRNHCALLISISLCLLSSSCDSPYTPLIGVWSLEEEYWVDSKVSENREVYLKFTEDGFIVRCKPNGEETGERTKVSFKEHSFAFTNPNGILMIRHIVELTDSKLVYEHQDIGRLMDGGLIRVTMKRVL
jgi:hypothetical protein